MSKLCVAKLLSLMFKLWFFWSCVWDESSVLVKGN